MCKFHEVVLACFPVVREVIHLPTNQSLKARNPSTNPLYTNTMPLPVLFPLVFVSRKPYTGLLHLI